MGKKNLLKTAKLKKVVDPVVKKKKKITKRINGKAKEKKSKNYESMNFDEFMEKELDRSTDEESIMSSDDESKTHKEIQFGANDENNSDAEQTNEFESHKESLAKLKKIDPEFYKFLEENDRKLLQFDDSGSEDGEEDEVEQVHKPTGDLEVASDESDFEGEDEQTTDSKVVTLKMLKQWQSDIQTDKGLNTVGSLIKAFHAALIRITSEDNDFLEYKVDGSAVFNAVVQLCVLELGPALRRYLRLTTASKQPPHKCKKFPKIKAMLRDYFLDLLKLLGGVTSTNILNVLLKHLHYMSPFIVSFSTVAKRALKRLIYLWGTSEETVRVVAFMCILRITTNQQATFLPLVLKLMYITYVRNCKFMSKGTLPCINFMRRSLTEMYALDVNVSYEFVFLYIRQLAIHLRNAVTLRKKENFQSVYNWQYVNSLHLWATLLALTYNKSQLQPLIYPLVQITIGAIKLVPTPQYYPLRFHCIQILMDLSRDTNVFIPVLPFILEVLTNFNFKKNKRVSMKPITCTCLLRLSKSQLQENGFNDMVIENVYGLTLEYLANLSHFISFPDIALFPILQIKQFLKACPVASYSKKMKQILEKIQQNCQFIENERKGITFTLTDFKQIDAWETNVKNKGTPLNIFHESWHKLHLVKKRKEVTDNDAIAEYALPHIKKVKKSIPVKKVKEGPVELFPSDSESDEDVITKKLNSKVGNNEEVNRKKEKKRGKRAVKKQKNDVEETTEKDFNESVDYGDQQDIVEDLKDW